MTSTTESRKSQFVKRLSAEDEIEYASSRYGQTSWQASTLRFIHSQPVQLTLMGLLILDVLTLFMDLYIEAENPDCRYIVRDAVCQGGYEVTCTQKEESAVARALDGISLGILCIFMVENIALVIILGIDKFIRNYLYVIDFVVVAASLALEIALMMMREDRLATMAGVLVIVRLWRFVRLGHGLVSTTVEIEDEKVEKLEDRIAELEDLLGKNGIQVPEWTTKSTSEASDYHVMS